MQENVKQHQDLTLHIQKSTKSQMTCGLSRSLMNKKTAFVVPSWQPQNDKPFLAAH